MPLGFERLNERAQRPNASINFIKPLSTSSPQDQKTAQDFLERIAAQCYPVMKRDYISVMSLEEHEPNPDFLGRNFNAGEIIQLVLKDKRGRWLSFKFVQMVMMHELAHCKQMNHSRFFWQVRNQYADQMKELWGKKYEGEGMWGRGKSLTSGKFVHDRIPEGDDVPEHLCGGTYRRARGRKRKRGQNGDRDGDGGERPKLTYAERQQKRIARKFGTHGEGQGLGEDELVRGALEQGKRRPGKPRVANSKRGRELRASAALARFDAVKNEKREETPELGDDDGSETDWSDDEYAEDEIANGLGILHTLGKTIKDQNGRDMFQVCGDEGEEGDGGGKEMDELRLMAGDGSKDNDREVRSGQSNDTIGAAKETAPEEREDSETESEPDEHYTISQLRQSGTERKGADSTSQVGTVDLTSPAKATNPANVHQTERTEQQQPIPTHTQASASFHSTNSTLCPICSLENDPDSPTCIACAHVLRPSLMPNHWRCASEQCKGSKYVNAGDAGRCGLCGASKKKPAAAAVEGRAMGMGMVGAEVLRWD